MFNWTRLLVAGLLGGLLLYGASASRLPSTAQATPTPCDSNCRLRFDFYFCNAQSCITSDQATCLWCVYGGQCSNANGYSPTQPTCGNPINGPIYANLFYNDACEAACVCSGVQSVEGTGGAQAGQSVVQQVPVCIGP
jgi:hypothetical protein